MTKPSFTRLPRQITACGALVLILFTAGCEFAEEQFRDVGRVDTVLFRGAVVADEPEAALVGRETLMANGNAIDAVVAASMALAVTYPSQAGLLSSGMCLTRSSFYERNAVMDMIAISPANPGRGDRPAAIPTVVRGLFALQSRHGTFPWNKVVAPAEKMARFGFPVSRVLAQDLQRVGAALLVDDEARKLYGRADGQSVKREGDVIINTGLADIIFDLRTRGTKGFYNAESLERLALAARQAGGAWDAKTLFDTKPRWRDPISVTTSDFLGNVIFTPPPAAASLTAAQIWAMMSFDDFDQLNGLDEDEVLSVGTHLLAEAASLAYAERTRWERADGTTAENAQSLVEPAYIEALIDDFDPDKRRPASSLSPQPKTDFVHPAGTVVAAVDRQGSAAVCFYTMNNLFGTGRIAGDTGMLLPAMPGPGGRGPQGLVAAIAIDENRNGVYFAGGASGGVAAPTALIQASILPLLQFDSLDNSQRRARIHTGGNPDIIYYEKGLDAEVLQALSERGYQTQAVDTLGRVNAIVCGEGIPMGPVTCAASADPRGLGLAATANW